MRTDGITDYIFPLFVCRSAIALIWRTDYNSPAFVRLVSTLHVIIVDLFFYTVQKYVKSFQQTNRPAALVGIMPGSWLMHESCQQVNLIPCFVGQFVDFETYRRVLRLIWFYCT